ncbi:ferredoxin-NADP reductase [Microbacterium endophyticum]|uniref:Ferredoxin-NADP reductase n=1 Tax=Microbacterium endophyticum TaxID=1526412 RepID=A0A7W4V1W3_9MICO|nr:PDR/VanB family oxidoreductase [Microbacterium endophyticum]MBB2975347.1 ferredoxin-NADP reductase [Microbacterium endophyticum]NIK35634.1 ferredoxin-NADP reductase [Microbacterium endophyticum]
MTTQEEAADLPARVRTMTREADGVLSLELEPLSGHFPAWSPGAHIDLVLAGAPVRQYSLCGDPASERLRIAVLRESDSRGGSKAIHESVRVGDEVTVRGPRNHFALTDATDYIFIAGGIGITPILPMIASVAATDVEWRLLYLGATRDRMAFTDELKAYGDRVDIVARDESERADLAAVIAAHPTAHIYVCGPEVLMSSVSQLLPEASERLHLEYFSAPEVEYEPGGAFTVRLASTGLDLDVQPEQSVLEVIRAAGVDVLTDCEEGICGSCETKVLDGEVEHRDFVLTPQERAQNDCMMVCVSRANCALLVLDA